MVLLVDVGAPIVMLNDTKEAQYILKLLKARRGFETAVTLDDGRISRIINSSYGKDLGDEWESIQTNYSPATEGYEDISEIVKITDEHGNRIFKPARGRGRSE